MRIINTVININDISDVHWHLSWHEFESKFHMKLIIIIIINIHSDNVFCGETYYFSWGNIICWMIKLERIL